MSDCPTCGNRDYLCQNCKLEPLEDRHGTPSDHFETAADVDDQDDRDEDLEYCCTNCDHEFTGSAPCPECGSHRRRYIGPLPGEETTSSNDSEPEQAVTDGGTVTEGELVDRAVREAADLVDAGDSMTVAVDYVVDEHELGHRRDDVLERVRERLGRKVVADGGIKQSSAGAEYNQSRIGHHTYLTSIRMIAWRGEGPRIRRCHQHVAFDHAPPFSPFLPTLVPRAVGLSTNVTSATSRRSSNEVLGFQSRSRGEQNGSGTGCDDPKPVTDGGVDIDFDAIREEVSFFLRRANSGGAKAALHLPAENATREGVAFRPQELDATPDWQLTKRGCSDCFGTATRPTDEQCGRKPSDVLEEAGFDAVTDGGRDLDGRQAFLAGDAHWCDICNQPSDSLAELIHHDCNDGSEQTAVADGGHEPGSIENRLSEIDKQTGVVLEDLDDEGLNPTTRRLVEDYLGMIQFHTKTIEYLLEHGAPPYDDDDDDGTPIAVTDGGKSEHRARCEDCAWSYSDSDLVDVSDEMDRHARKEMHDVDLERAVATDGGVDQSSSGTGQIEFHSTFTSSATKMTRLPRKSRTSATKIRASPCPTRSVSIRPIVHPMSKPARTVAVRPRPTRRRLLPTMSLFCNLRGISTQPEVASLYFVRRSDLISERRSLETDTAHDDDREIRTDGGQEAAAYMNEEVELRIRGDRVHVQTLLAILSVTSSQMSGGKLDQAGELAKSVPDQVLTLEDARDAAHSMIASGGEGWAEDDPAEVLDVEFSSVVDDEDDRDIMTDGGVDQSSSGTDQSNRRKSVQPQGHFFPVPIGRNTPSGSSREAIGLPQFSQITTVVGCSCNAVIDMGNKWSAFGLNRTRIQHAIPTHLLRAIFQWLHRTLQSGTDPSGGDR